MISFSDRLVVFWTNPMSWFTVSGFRSFIMLITMFFIDSLGFWFLVN